MAYRIFILDQDNVVELDCEGILVQTDFSISTVEDISKRPGTLTKSIVFKGSKINNEAFGNLAHLNRSSNFAILNKVGFNYNPLRTVDCLIYEDAALLLRGFLRVTKTPVDGNGNVNYETTVTDSTIEFRGVLADNLMEVLDMSDLQHRFNWNNIRDSWEVRTERYNKATDSYTYKPFEKGSGVVYPFIDYGNTFKKESVKNDVSMFHVKNFKPAVYVKEYINRIFSQPSLSGYTWELKGSTDFQSKFNSLIIPTNTETVVSKATGALGAMVSSTVVQTRDSRKTSQADGGLYVWLNLPTHSGNLLQSFGNYLNGNQLPDAVQLSNNTFTANGKASVTLGLFNNLSVLPIKLRLELVERAFVEATGDFDNTSSWSVVASSSQVLIPRESGIGVTTLSLEIGEREYVSSTQLALRVKVEGASYINEIILPSTQYQFNGASLRFPKDDNSVLTTELGDGSVVTPAPMVGVKQMDFLKSVMLLMNLYMYSESDRPKHMIFEQYSDYYALTHPSLLANYSLDWTHKVDFSKGVKGDSNSIPRNYLFTYKEDGDYFNSIYKANYAEVYGQFKFTDSLGVANQEKKVELIFSPTPLTNYLGTGRFHAGIFSGTLEDRKPAKSNIRILFYNGVKSCSSYNVAKDVLVNGVYDTSNLAAGLTSYSQAGHYLYQSGPTNMTAIEDLCFGTPRYLFFPSKEDHVNCPKSYELYYRNQVTDMTNPNTTFIECEVVLNEMDISSLSLKTPVFIDMGEFGHAYFKVLSVNYQNNKTTSTVQLQKIAM